MRDEEARGEEPLRKLMKVRLLKRGDQSHQFEALLAWKDTILRGEEFNASNLKTSIFSDDSTAEAFKNSGDCDAHITIGE
ncbi:hypothetical protein KFK09_014281 [Dendrobium nobile]|uniref:Uncharacterized protein n=1 Tax=Dendrobium nobile TaxID=94219 RepID=A0A8T3B9M4_DENNO|nr:hypothetical protein KFK09_014281 [Dendrobium nobile]